ncbi:hypothetical protein OE88DRAFT_1655530 [Heliocybe sulcata]|uniref:Uncharacterized protein n=1 Tax=Heliocybe sulcata TaxID=5364 RepID=A0A5C3N7X2_9AGAM|nr:hypothetical protein OE88DRAFT_1655530 [Heliocybe sulcata]
MAQHHISAGRVQKGWTAEPAIEHLRRSNDPPSGMEDATLRGYLSDSYGVLQSVDSEIATLRERLAQRIRERDAIRAQMDECKGLLSPLRRLPLELLSHIFVDCLPGNTFIIPHRLSAPLLLTQVCSTWRRTALSTSALWCSLKIEMGQRDEPRTHLTKAELMRTWLSRAGVRPLSLHYADNRDGVDIVPDGPDMLHILREYLPQCRVLHFFALSGETLGGVRFPYLERLDISVVFRLPRDFLIWTPCIESLKVSWAHFLYLDMANMPWENLTSLHIRSIHRPRECVNALRKCTALRTCTLELNRNWDAEVEDKTDVPEKVVLPGLQFLKLATHTSGIFDAIAESIIAPALKHLEISSLFSKVGSYDVWSSMFIESGIALETLDLHSIQPPFDTLEDFINMLELMGSLRKLSITGPEANDPFDGRTDEFMVRITHSVPGPYRCEPRLLPNLEELILSVESEPFTCSLVTHMLKSRVVTWPEDPDNVATVALKKADIRMHSGYEEDKTRRWTVSCGVIAEELVERQPWERY